MKEIKFCNMKPNLNLNEKRLLMFKVSLKGSLKVSLKVSLKLSLKLSFKFETPSLNLSPIRLSFKFLDPLKTFRTLELQKSKIQSSATLHWCADEQGSMIMTSESPVGAKKEYKAYFFQTGVVSGKNTLPVPTTNPFKSRERTLGKY